MDAQACPVTIWSRGFSVLASTCRRLTAPELMLGRVNNFSSGQLGLEDFFDLGFIASVALWTVDIVE